MAKFTHLHVHTEYSLLDGLSKIEKLFDRALEYGMDSLAITDHGAMYGAIKFYLTAQEYGMKPIIGMEAYLAARSRFDKQADIDSDRFHLLLLAKNEIGYKNLMKLTTLAHLEGFYYKPRIDMELLRQYHDGLIAASGCLEGIIPSLLTQDREKEAEDKTREFLDIFGEDFYLELQDHPTISHQKIANERLVKLSRKLGIPLVATADLHYVDKDDAEAQDALLAVQTQRLIADKDRLSMIDSPDLYLRSQEEMIKAFKDYPEAITNTREITKKCNLNIKIGEWILPLYPLSEGETPDGALKKMVYERLRFRYENPTEEIIRRVEYELETIKNKGFSTYFLIVQDFVNWAKRQKIRVGPGRGSAAGSLVSYILRITSIDPLRHNLPFERFMNPQRPSPPDIDLDFADDRRDEVIGYITEKYGRDRVAQIITFNVMKAKEAIRDIGRVLGMPYSEPDKIAKLIPLNMSIGQALKTVPELAMCYKEPKFKKLLDLAMKVEGTVRHASTHAAGVVIADRELTEYAPLQKETNGERLMTQYDMYSLDLNVSEKAIGLLKMDILGLRNLTILEKALEYIKSHSGDEVDLSEIPLDDKGVLKMISEGQTTGVFQLESAGMRRLARKLRPSKFSDISAMVALFRPGPMQFIDEFIAGKHNPKIVRYPHQDLKPILEETYGIAVYQEQCMQIANVMAGYSLGEADILRRAIGKKKKLIMEKEEKNFIQRAVKLGYPKETAEKVFGLIERFAGYGFNKAHSTSYAMIAYQTAYVKYHWPVEFMAALLTAESAGATGPARDAKIALAIEECRRMKIKMLPPDINASMAGFTIEKNPDSLGGKAIRFGLGAIKNVGEIAINVILFARKTGGEFRSLSDFCQRVDQQKVNRKVLESLIKAGAMDHFGKRAQMISAVETIRSKSLTSQKDQSSGQTSLFGSQTNKEIVDKDPLPDIEEFSPEELLSLEKELLGFYLTANPLSPVLELLEKYHLIKIYELEQMENNRQPVKIGGIISDIRIVITKKTGQEMAFAKIEDGTGVIETVIFPKVYAKTKACWIKDKIVIIEGKAEFREENLGLVVEDASLFDPESGILPPTESEGMTTSPSITDVYEIKIPANISPGVLVELNKILRKNIGNDKAALVFFDKAGNRRRMILPYGIKYSRELMNQIENLLSGLQK